MSGTLNHLARRIFEEITLNAVKVHKQELLETLRKNRTEHRRIFEEALMGYKAKVIAELERMLEKARAGERVAESLHIPQPVDQTREYDRAIKMLEMSVEDTIQLNANEFESYVMDRWHWKHAFLMSNSLYSKHASDTLVAEGE